MKNLLTLAAAALIFGACYHNEPAPALDGTYKASLPCADCPGIDATLTVKSGAYTYTEEAVYKDEPQKETTAGKLVFKTPDLFCAGANCFLIDGESLHFVNSSGEKAGGDIAKYYIFKKVQ
ncbi:MAG: copper resistance protein NlpE N-terminal domain-containing protein [Helicobacteraceae bacterium]